MASCVFKLHFRLSGVFPGVQTAVKKREQSLQEYNRTQAKFNKYQERDRTGQNIGKLDTVMFPALSVPLVCQNS